MRVVMIVAALMLGPFAVAASAAEGEVSELPMPTVVENVAWAGSMVTVSGSGCPARADRTELGASDVDDVYIFFNDDHSVLMAAQVRADGTWSRSIAIPDGLAPGTYNIDAACTDTNPIRYYPTVTLLVIEYPGTPVVAPATARAGDQLTMTGTGCSFAGVGGQVRIDVGAGAGVVEVTATNDGSWSASVQVPVGSPTGGYAAVAQCTDVATGQSFQYDGAPYVVEAVVLAAPVVIAQPQFTG